MAYTPPLIVTPGALTCGLWCPYCLLPSGYVVGMYVMGAVGPHRIATMRRCYDCDADLPRP
jgi:hypothetical protein